MACWLLKTDPGAYSWGDLARDGRRAWTGLASSQAQASLRAMRPGDRVILYDSGARCAMGVAEVLGAAYPDAGSAGLLCIDLKALEPLPAPVPLDALKEEPAFEGSVLLTQGRSKIVPLSPAEWREIQALADVIARTGGLRPEERF